MQISTRKYTYLPGSDRWETEYSLIQLAVGASTGGPARIIHHRTCDQIGPAIMLRVKPQGTLKCIEQCHGCILRKANAIAIYGVSKQVGHSIGQTTGRVDDWQRPITQCNQLPQAARLEGAGHQKEIRARVDTMGKRNVEVKVSAHVTATCSKFLK